MSWKKRIASIILIVSVFAGVYYLWWQGVTTLSEIGATSAGVLFTVGLAIMAWGFREDFEQMIGMTKKSNEELDLLIKPLYLAFDKFPARGDGSSSSLIHVLSTPPELLKNETYKTSSLKEIVEAANLVIDILKQCRELAQPQLREQIDEYLEMRRIHQRLEKPYGSNSAIRYYSDAERILNEIANTVKERYDKLTKTY
jgi:hypothetical protein